jgi:hypothetical protein
LSVDLSQHVILYVPGEPPAACIQFLRGAHLPSPGSYRLGTPELEISGLTGSPLLRPAGLLASLTGDFYFRAFNGLVTLPVAGYDYGGNWTISTGGTHTRWTDD